MAVMDADTGKLLNYRQLMRSPKYRQAWSLSSTNEFGQLANGIEGRIKKLPTQSSLYSNTMCQQNGRKMSRTGNSFAQEDQKRQNQIKQGSP
jgi:hypothetical protein